MESKVTKDQLEKLFSRESKEQQGASASLLKESPKTLASLSWNEL